MTLGDPESPRGFLVSILIKVRELVLPHYGFAVAQFGDETTNRYFTVKIATSETRARVV